MTITLTEILFRGIKMKSTSIKFKKFILQNHNNKKDRYGDNPTKWDFMGSMG